jgi:hypothetical protein
MVKNVIFLVFINQAEMLFPRQRLQKSDHTDRFPACCPYDFKQRYFFGEGRVLTVPGVSQRLPDRKKQILISGFPQKS